MSVATGGAATGMPGLPEVWQWEEQLVGFGTRYMGSSAPPVFSLNLAQTPAGGYVSGQSSDQAAADYAAYAAALANPAWQGIFDPVPLLDAKDAGVLGVVVAWTGCPTE